MIKVLVYGWYGKDVKNIGDLLFKNAFKELFPEFNFKFVQELKQEDIETFDVIIFGGGSFIYAPIKTNCQNIFEQLKNKKIFYIGVGTETDIHSDHQGLMKIAKLIATRTEGSTTKLKQITNNEIIEIPDLVYTLQHKIIKPEIVKSNTVLILPNAELVPKWNDIQWKHSAWNYFKSEFAQFLDVLLDEGYQIEFAALCHNNNKHDSAAATEIVNYMQKRKYNTIGWSEFSDISMFEEIMSVIGRFEIVISQRYHGSVLSHMAGKPCLSLAHHDKLKNPTNSSITISYYELSKQKIYDNFFKCKNINILPIKLDMFKRLRERVYTLLEQNVQIYWD